MTVKEQSKHDLGGTLKSSHEPRNDSLRVMSANSEVPPLYDRVVLTYNSEGSVTQAVFYDDTKNEITEITAADDVASSLNDKYFYIYSALDATKYHVWYNVGGAGTDPNPGGSTGIQVNLQANDPAQVVALATAQIISGFADFTAERLECTSIIKVYNANDGDASDSVDVDSGFAVNKTQDGVTELIKTITIPYENNIKYTYNTLEKKFEVFPDLVVQQRRLTGPGKITEVILNDATWTALPASPLAGRGVLAIQNPTSKEIKINYDDTAGYVGMVVGADGNRYYDVENEDVLIFYGRSKSGNVTITVEEIAK